MPRYTVLLTDQNKLDITADDVTLETCDLGEHECLHHYWNFVSGEITVAAVPAGQVAWIVSKEK